MKPSGWYSYGAQKQMISELLATKVTEAENIAQEEFIEKKLKKKVQDKAPRHSNIECMGRDGQLAKNTEMEWPENLQQNHDRVTARKSWKSILRGKYLNSIKYYWKIRQDVWKVNIKT